jgi:hypothetical protein
MVKAGNKSKYVQNCKCKTIGAFAFSELESYCNVTSFRVTTLENREWKPTISLRAIRASDITIVALSFRLPDHWFYSHQEELQICIYSSNSVHYVIPGIAQNTAALALLSSAWDRIPAVPGNFGIFTEVTMKNAASWDITIQFVPHRKHIASLLQCPAS